MFKELVVRLMDQYLTNNKFRLLDSDLYRRIFKSSDSVISPKAVATDFVRALGLKEDKYYCKDCKLDCEQGLYVEHLMVDDKGDLVDRHDNDRVGLRLVTDYSTIKDQCSNIRKENKLLRVTYGEYPKTIVTYGNKEYEEMEKSFLYDKENSLTGKEYDLSYLDYSFFERHGNATEFVCNGKKYVHFKYYYIDSYKGSYWDSERDLYFRVEPVEWLVDVDKNIAISEDILIPSVRCNSHHYDLEKYVGQTLSREISYVHNTFDNTITQDESDSRTEEVDSIVGEIEKELVNYYGKEDIMAKVDKLIEDYNCSILDSDSDKLTTKQKDKELLFASLINDLNSILSQLKQNSLMYQKYTDMLSLIKEWIEVLDSKDYQKRDINPISYMILEIKKYIFPFLEDKEMEIKLRELICDQERTVMDYINSGQTDGFKNVEEFEYDFRLRLQVYLLSLNTKVFNKDMATEVREAYKSMLTDKEHKDKYNYIGFYIEKIKELKDTITSSGYEEDIKTLKEVLNEPIDYSADIYSIISELTKRYSSLYRIVLDRESQISQKNEISNYLIKRKSKSS